MSCWYGEIEDIQSKGIYRKKDSNLEFVVICSSKQEQAIKRYRFSALSGTFVRWNRGIMSGR